MLTRDRTSVDRAEPDDDNGGTHDTEDTEDTETPEPGPMRREHDLLGDLDVPADAYYGVHTAAGRRELPDHRHARLGLARPRHRAGRREAGRGARQPRPRSCCDRPQADAIVAACEEIRGGALHDQFVVDLIQGGAGTSTNMNANEVVANRALELLGHHRGDYAHLHPLEHVNLGPEHQRRLPDRDQDRARLHHSAPAGRAWPCCARPSPRRPPSSRTSSRWAAPSCRTPCP